MRAWQLLGDLLPGFLSVPKSSSASARSGLLHVGGMFDLSEFAGIAHSIIHPGSSRASQLRVVLQITLLTSNLSQCSA